MKDEGPHFTDFRVELSRGRVGEQSSAVISVYLFPSLTEPGTNFCG
jgi:hypothetical protein